MSTFNWASFDTVSIVNSTILAPQTVSLSQVFAAIPLPTDDDYRLAIKIDGISLDASAGPFTLLNDAAKGEQDVVLSGGDGALLNAGDVIILRDGAGNESVGQVDATHVGSDTVPLKELSKLDLPGGTASIERAPAIDVSGTEGVGSGTTTPRNETIWLTEQSEYKGWWVTRLRYDHGTSFTVTTFDFTATNIQIHEWVDHANVHRSDRRTQRTLMGGVAVAPTALTAFSESFLSWGSGHKVSSRSFGNDVDRYAEQHPPVRLNIDVTAGADFTGGVTVEGFRTIWSPVRDTMGIGVSSVRVSPENFEQFQVGDVVTLFSLSSNANEPQTIATKTSPDLLNFVGVTVNTYGVDDVVGIVQTEVVDVSGGIGIYYTADAWVYPLWYNTASGSEDFTFEVFQSVQGFTGALHSVDNRTGSGHATATAVNQKEGVYQVAAAQIQYGDGVTPVLYGGVGGACVYPRNVDAQLLAGTSESVLWFGTKNHFGSPVAGLFILRGASAGSNDFWQILGNATNGVVLFKTVIALRTVVSGVEAGRCDVLDPAFWRMRDVWILTRNIARQSTSDVRGRDVRSAIDTANGAVSAGSGASFQINAPTGLNDFAIVGDVNAYARGVAFIPTTSYPGQPIRVNGFNQFSQHGTQGTSRRCSWFAQNLTYTGRCINSLFSYLEVRSATGQTIDAESAFTLDLLVIGENGAPIENTRAYLIDSLGATVVNLLTDSFGRIPQQEIVSHRYRKLNAGGSDLWRVGDAVPANITLTEFNPFKLIVVPDSVAGVTGFSPHEQAITVKPFLPSPQDLTVVLRAPRPAGNYGDQAHGEF